MRQRILFLLMTLLPVAASAYNVKVGNVFYNCDAATMTATVTYEEHPDEDYYCNYTSSGDIVIPSEIQYNGAAYRVTSIGHDAFRLSEGLTSITIPNSVTTIGDFAFFGCSGLTAVTIDKTEPISIGSFTFTSPENATLYVPKGSKAAYEAADYWKEFKEIKEFVRDKVATYTVENEAKTLTVNNVAEATEEEVEIPASVTVEGTAYPVKAIAASAFENNTVIKQVSIPASIEEIGDAAFADCSSLSAITCLAAEPIALGSTEAKARTRSDGDGEGPNVFNGVDKVTCVLYVPAASISKYKATDGWKDFMYIVGIGTKLILGDVNGDNELDNKDLQALIAHVMGETPAGFDPDMADVNQDGQVNVHDVVYLIKLLNRE